MGAIYELANILSDSNSNRPLTVRDNVLDVRVEEELESCANSVSPGLLLTLTQIVKSCGKSK